MRIGHFVLAVLAFAAAPALAQEENPLAKLAQTSPIVAFLQNQGVKLTYLGDDGGLKAYLGESANGRMQVFYVTPDGEHMVAGVMFRRDGTNLTGVQIGEMQRRFEAAQGQFGATTPGSTGSIVGPPTVKDSPNPKDAKTAPAAKDTKAAPVAEPKAPAAAPKAEAAPLSADKWLSSLDKTAFSKAVDGAAWFSVGEQSAPAIYMVADPQCPFCHDAWSKLRPLVYASKLQVRVILIAGLKGSDPLARAILTRKDPGLAWIKGEGSTSSVEIRDIPKEGSKEWDDAGRFLDINEAVAKQFNVTATPFLAYFSKDGKLYSSSGLPDQLDAFLSAATK